MFEKTSLTSLDAAVFGTSLCASVMIGLYFANKNKTFKEYTTGGGDQSLWPVAISMAACYTGTITMTGNPVELYLHGPSLTISFLANLIGWPVMAFIFLPVFERTKAISVFDYIENRYRSAKLRKFVSLIFIIMMTFYSSVSIYIPSLSLHTMLNLPKTLSIGLIGFICIIYATFGGIKAVVWTNLFHLILICLSLITILLAGSITAEGGFKQVYQSSMEGNRLSLETYYNFDMTTRHTIYNTILSFTIQRCFLHGLSQMQVQSALSLSSLRRGQLAMLLASIIFVLIQFLASAIGFILHAQFKDCDPYLDGQIDRREELVYYYLSNYLSNYVPAIQGIFIAGIFSSTLTSMSSFQTSMSAMVIEDFIRPAFTYNKRILSDEFGATLSKLTAFLFGLLCIILTLVVDKLDGLMQVCLTLFGTFGTPIFAVFTLGVMTKFINTKGILAGLVCSLTFGLYVQLSQIIKRVTAKPTLPLSMAGCASTSILVVENNNRILLNNSNSTSNLLLLREIVEESDNLEFKFEQISYFWIPFFMMVIVIIVSTIVSLLTGGLKQNVDDRYLATFLHSNKSHDESDQEKKSINHITMVRPPIIDGGEQSKEKKISN